MEKAALRPQYISFLEKQKQKEGSLLLSGNQLKIIAMITMLIDHIGVNLFPSVTILRVIGRLSFPIFAYMIAEGCRYTRDRKNYLFTIAALGILCQLVFYVFTQSLYQSILITFTISIVTIYAIDGLIYGKNNYSRAAWGGVLLIALYVAFIAPVRLEARGFALDYGAAGAALPVAVYYSRGRIIKLLSLTIMLCVVAYMSLPVQWYSLFSVILLMLYSGFRGKMRMKYVFYVFYPAHLAVIYLIGMMMH